MINDRSVEKHSEMRNKMCFLQQQFVVQYIFSSLANLLAREPVRILYTHYRRWCFILSVGKKKNEGLGSDLK